MKIAIPAEADETEPRVAATPDSVKKIRALGAEVVVEAGAGVRAGVSDAEYEAAGAGIARGAEVVRDADVILKVRRPTAGEAERYKKGALVIGIMDPFGNEAALAALAKAGVTAFAMELLPRITRAQGMDVLSSQANLAGYRAMIDATYEYGRALPMMMTAAGTGARPGFDHDLGAERAHLLHAVRGRGDARLGFIRFGGYGDFHAASRAPLRLHRCSSRSDAPIDRGARARLQLR